MVSDQTERKPITVISSMAMRQVLAELANAFEQVSEHRVAIESAGGVEAFRRVQDGELFDVVVLASDAIDRLTATGRVIPLSRVDLARSNVAVAVATGKSRPQIGSEAAIRNAVLGARSIGYSTGPSGVQLAGFFERWGIAETIASRLVRAKPGIPVAELVASGVVEIGFQQLSELLHQPGIDVVGCLPADMCVTTIFSAGTCMGSGQRKVATELKEFLASPPTVPVKRKFGMAPID